MKIGETKIPEGQIALSENEGVERNHCVCFDQNGELVFAGAIRTAPHQPGLYIIMNPVDVQRFKEFSEKRGHKLTEIH